MGRPQSRVQCTYSAQLTLASQLYQSCLYPRPCGCLYTVGPSPTRTEMHHYAAQCCIGGARTKAGCPAMPKTISKIVTTPPRPPQHRPRCPRGCLYRVGSGPTGTCLCPLAQNTPRCCDKDSPSSPGHCTPAAPALRPAQTYKAQEQAARSMLLPTLPASHTPCTPVPCHMSPAHTGGPGPQQQDGIPGLDYPSKKQLQHHHPSLQYPPKIQLARLLHT